MSKTYYPQSSHRPSTMTVGALIERLQALPDKEAPVIFRSPLHGVYGPETGYTIDKVAPMALEREVTQFPAGTRFDEETGEDVPYEAFEEVAEAWAGVVIE